MRLLWRRHGHARAAIAHPFIDSTAFFANRPAQSTVTLGLQLLTSSQPTATAPANSQQPKREVLSPIKDVSILGLFNPG